MKNSSIFTNLIFTFLIKPKVYFILSLSFSMVMGFFFPINFSVTKIVGIMISFFIYLTILWVVWGVIFLIVWLRMVSTPEEEPIE
jgi:hypothetical protein